MLNGLCMFFWEGCYFSCSSGDKSWKIKEWLLLGRVLVYAQDLNKILNKSKLKPETAGNMHAYLSAFLCCLVFYVVGVTSHLRQLSLWGKSLRYPSEGNCVIAMMWSPTKYRDLQILEVVQCCSNLFPIKTYPTFFCFCSLVIRKNHEYPIDLNL